MTRVLAAVLLFGAFCTQACGGSAPALPPAEPDKPVPASVARQTVQLTIDLERSANCEEDFDLAIYENRGVELVQWDEPALGSECSSRHISIKFLPERLPRAELMQLVRELSTNVSEEQTR